MELDYDDLVIEDPESYPNVMESYEISEDWFRNKEGKNEKRKFLKPKKELTKFDKIKLIKKDQKNLKDLLKSYKQMYPRPIKKTIDLGNIETGKI